MDGPGFLNQKQRSGKEQFNPLPKKLEQEQVIKGFEKLKAELKEHTGINDKILCTGECLK